jgi:hypothetical protein
MNKRWLVLGGVGLALLGVPYLACSSHEAPGEATLSEADMKGAVLGTWQGSAEIDGEVVPFSLVLQQASTKSKAGALNVVGTLTSENPALNGNVDGAFSPDADVEHLTLALRIEDGKTLSGAVEKSTLSDGHIFDKAPAGSFSMFRP